MQSPELSGWLLTYLVHSTLLLGAAAVLAPRFRSHRVREMLWKTALFGGFVTATGQTLLRVSPLAGRMTVQAPQIAERQTPPARLSNKKDKDEAFPSSPSSLSSPSAAKSASAVDGISQERLLVLSWMVGAAFLLGVYLVRRIRFSRRIAARETVTHGPVSLMLDELRSASGITRNIRLTRSSALPSPVALGTNEIAVPDAALTDLDPGQQRSMLAHELAHLDRGDPSWLTAACIAEQIAFIQPLNRLARRRIQESAEYLCDEWAVRRTGSGVLLAKCLAKVAEWLESSPRTLPVSGMAEEKSHLVARVRRLLDGAPFPKAPGRRTLVLASFAVLGITLLALPGVSMSSQTSPSSLSSPSPPSSLSSPSVADTGRIVTALMGVLKDPDVEVRRAAVRSLARFEDPASIPGLREALRDSDAEVRANAVEALGDLHDAGSADAIAALIKDSNKEVRAHAIEALTDLEITTPPAGLLDALRDPDADVRHQAIHAVAHFEDARAVPTLRILLDDPNGEVREAAVEALGEIRNEAAIQALIGALKAKDPKVRQAAADALGKKE